MARRFFLEHKGQKVEIGDAEVRLGAAPESTVVVAGKGVEPLVAVARREGDGVVLESRARENEAKVNGRLLSVADLAPGARLKLGDVEMRVAGAGVDLRLESDEGTFPIKVGANLIGRLADAAVMVDNPTVSRKHALVFLLPNGQARIRHLGAQNGTWVDGVQLGQVELAQGDKIEIGEEQLFFFASAPVTAAAAPAPESAVPAIEPEPGGAPPPDATVIAGALPQLPPPGAAAAPEPEGPRFELVLGDETHVLGPGAFVIGRTPECDLSLPDDALVSRRHTQLTVDGDGVRLRDLDSSNGTRVNGHRVEREITLADGDRIGIGGAEIVFHAVRPPDPYAATVLGVPAPAPAFDKTMLAADLGVPGPGAAGAAAAANATPADPARAAALRALDLPPQAGPDEVQRRYRELYSDYQIRFTNAPTPELKQRYGRRLEELRAAVEALAPGSGSAESGSTRFDLPAARPVDAPVARPAGAPAAAPVAAAASAGVAAAAAPPPPPGPPAAPEDPGLAPAADAPPAAARSGRLAAVPRSTWVMAAVLLLLVAATAAGAVLHRGAAATEARLAAELAAKQQEVAAAEQRIPGASLELAELQELKGSKLEPFEFKICNLGTRPLFVEWLHASWIGPEGAFEEFDSALVGYETWEVAPGGTGKFGYVSGDEVVWDGKAVFVSALLIYGGEEYFRSGAVQGLGVDCYNLDLDR